MTGSMISSPGWTRFATGKDVYRVTLTNNPFKAFYTTPVEIGQATGAGGYSNPDGAYTKLGELTADVQPYSGGLAAEEYGLTEQVEKRMYCDNSEHLKQGNIAAISGDKYDIVYTEAWEAGAMVLLRKRRKQT